MAQPLYLQVADELEEQIRSGDLSPGSQLPTEDDLRDKYRASRNTVRDAIKRLVGQGLVETRPGQGTFVTTKVDPFVTVLNVGDPSEVSRDEGGATYLSDVSASHRKPYITAPRVEVQTAPEVITRRLRVPSDTQLVSRHEQRYIDDIPWSLQTSYYPMEFADRGAERLRSARNIPEGTVQYLADTLRIHQVGYRDWITVRAPNPTEEDYFKLPSDGRVGMYEIFRIAFDKNGVPMRLTVTVYPTDRNQFIVNVGKVPG